MGQGLLLFVRDSAREEDTLTVIQEALLKKWEGIAGRYSGAD